MQLDVRGTVVRGLLLAVMLLASCSDSGGGGLGERTLGATCSPNEHCQPELICFAGYCRAPCDNQDACSGSDTCTGLEQGPSACLPADEADASVPEDAGEDGAQPEVDADTDAAEPDMDADDSDANPPVEQDSQIGVDADAEPAKDGSAMDADGAGDSGADASDGQAPDATPQDAAAANGAACAADQQCVSGHCVQPEGVCCDIACTGACRACVSAKTGYPTGICAPVSAGTDPDQECAASGSASCGANGTGCNGDTLAPDCRRYPSGTQCAASTCAAGAATPARTCNG
ncbi:MAG TPA: hypothetical protein VFZ61_01980, partial [Polyangiales bacterium]